jgi:hypothetical protein
LEQTADGDKHRWPKILQVGRDTVKVKVLKKLAQIAVYRQSESAPGGLSGREKSLFQNRN